eukprot:GHVN01003157.1.p1 GENE.GHVN01003157.1~~GHVN01003157.1.p1  ORF type:complete len:141 (-),score=51.09 GHVN01003157.1:62-484(-)
MQNPSSKSNHSNHSTHYSQTSESPHCDRRKDGFPALQSPALDAASWPDVTSTLKNHSTSTLPRLIKHYQGANKRYIYNSRCHSPKSEASTASHEAPPSNNSSLINQHQNTSHDSSNPPHSPHSPHSPRSPHSPHSPHSPR